MKYSILRKNNKDSLKVVSAGSKSAEIYLAAEPAKNEEGLSKKTFLRYMVNNKGEQVIELFGSEPVIIVVDDYKIIHNDKS